VHIKNTRLKSLLLTEAIGSDENVEWVWGHEHCGDGERPGFSAYSRVKKALKAASSSGVGTMGSSMRLNDALHSSCTFPSGIRRDQTRDARICSGTRRSPGQSRISTLPPTVKSSGRERSL